MPVSKLKELSNWTPQQIADMALATFREGRRTNNQELISESFEVAAIVGRGSTK